MQALHLMNSQALYDKVTSDKGLAATLAASGKAEAAILDELYLAVYSRVPTDAEREAAGKFLAEQKDQAARRCRTCLGDAQHAGIRFFKH